MSSHSYHNKKCRNFSKNKYEYNDSKELKFKYPPNDVRNSIYKYIDINFSYGKVDKYKIIIMIENGYVNISRICKKYKYDMNEWFEEPHNQKKLEYIENEFERNSLIKITENKKKMNGIYMHPKIFIHFLMYFDAKFAIDVSDIILNKSEYVY